MSTDQWRISRRVLIDSSIDYAISDRESREQRLVIASMERLAAQHRHPSTTNFILAETHALVLNRLGRDVATRLLQEIDEGSSTIVRVSAADERRAREIIMTHDDKDYSLTDATSVAVMERLHIGEAFTFDRHFAQFGFAVCGPAPE